jgi:hypothetical protein
MILQNRFSNDGRAFSASLAFISLLEKNFSEDPQDVGLPVIDPEPFVKVR